MLFEWNQLNRSLLIFVADHSQRALEQSSSLHQKSRSKSPFYEHSVLSERKEVFACWSEKSLVSPIRVLYMALS